MSEFQLVLKEDLERIWKSSRRDRLRIQENKIWESFCKEQDVVKDISHDNPYEFLENFPDTYVKELKETKPLKMKQSQNGTDMGDTNQEVQGAPVTCLADDQHSIGDCMPEVHVVNEQTAELEPVYEETLNASNETSIECDNVDTIKSELDHGDTVCTPKQSDNGGDIPQASSGRNEIEDQYCPESSSYDVELNLGLSPKDQVAVEITERSVHASRSPLKNKPLEKAENTSSRLKSSVYCAKLKDIKIKINETLSAIIQSLLSDDVALYFEKLTKVQKCSKEFCNRFNRVYMYQLQQQLQSIKRNNAIKLPFGKHTQFQAQMVRMESLHHNILQALQVFHKSFEQTHCIGDNIDHLRNLMQLLRDTLSECGAIAWPAGVAAERDNHNHTILSNCESVNEALSEHAIKMERLVSHKDGFISNRHGKNFKQPLEKSRTKLKMGASKLVLGSGFGADSRLSMYSFDTLRINMTPKGKYVKGDPYRSAVSAQKKSSRTALLQHNPGYRKPNNTPKSEQDNQVTSQKLGKTSSKRPLMKDPQRGRPKKRIQKEKDIKTMVEQVDASPARTSKERKRVSPEQTPTSIRSPKSFDSVTTKSNSPRIEKNTMSIDNTSNDVRIENTKIPNIRSDDVDTAKDLSGTNTTSPLKLNEVGDGLCQVSRQQHTTFPVRDSTSIRRDRVCGVSNAQLVVCVSDDSTRHTEPLHDQMPVLSTSEEQRLSEYEEKYRMKLEPDENTVSRWTQHRALFLQHMLTSHMYTNSSVRQPWHVVGRISEKIIDDALVKCARELQIEDKVLQMYRAETC